MAETVNQQQVPSQVVEKKKEKREKREKKEVAPEPEFYISEEDKKKALEETKAMFDLSIKKKSKKRSTLGENGEEGLDIGMLIGTFA